MKKANLKDLIKKYLLGKASGAEEARVDRYYDALKSDVDITTEKKEEELQEIENRIFRNIVGQTTVEPIKRTRTTYWRWAAAVLLPFFLVTGYYLSSLNQTTLDLHTVEPGKIAATLITDDGQAYSLASVTDLNKLEGEGVYRTDAHTEAAMHEIVTPKGGYYQLQLPDGTSVWLNAETSIRFSTDFTSDTREVYLSGEAYFDVAHNKNVPFMVHTDLQSTKVLGTKFNITSYKGQLTDVVTLLEGAVEASSKSNETIRMAPGHQAYIGQQIRYVAVDNAMDVAAWRNGEFYFDNTPMTEVLQMIGRWYNVEVDLNNLPANRLNGLINRNLPLDELLDLIETTSNVKIVSKNGRLTANTKHN